ncbi:DUF2489 domain-containing protein [Alteromonadaceae bacterium M269]|nr:DUF2489 domain-containing protein [Alteromonadaceae bacterium M269]
MMILLISLAILIIAGLSFYAGKLLWQLKQQNERQQQARNKRIETITDSIHVIAKAMEQQQCDLSEGCIRLCNLLNAIPSESPADYPSLYPNVYELFHKVEHMPTHKAREALPKKERLRQDIQRAEWESELETAILPELAKLKQFNAA